MLQLCWQAAGVERQGPVLGRSLATVRRQRSAIEAEPLLHTAMNHSPAERLLLEEGTRRALLRQQDLRQRLVLAELLIEAAAFRCESRGGHHRIDAPAPQPFWRCHSLQRRGASISTRAVQDQTQGRGPL